MSVSEAQIDNLVNLIDGYVRICSKLCEAYKGTAG